MSRRIATGRDKEGRMARRDRRRAALQARHALTPSSESSPESCLTESGGLESGLSQPGRRCGGEEEAVGGAGGRTERVSAVGGGVPGEHGCDNNGDTNDADGGGQGVAGGSVGGSGRRSSLVFCGTM